MSLQTAKYQARRSFISNTNVVFWKTAGVSLPFISIHKKSIMRCEVIQTDLPLYGDGHLSKEHSLIINAHLEICPVCRAKAAAHREIANDLRKIERPNISLDMQRSIRNSLRSELTNGRHTPSVFSNGFSEWLQMKLIPYAIGVTASLVIGFGVLSVLLSNIRSADTATAGKPNVETGILLAGGRGISSQANGDAAIFPADYARTRLAVSSESPSLNPQGSLVMLTSSMLRNNKSSDSIVVVADVFSNGLAKIQEVVSPNYSSKAISDLEKALDADLGNAPFLPASLDQRSDSVRVILRFQQVNVSAREKIRPRRL